MIRDRLAAQWFLPRPVERVSASRGGVPLEVGAVFRVVSWNIQFAAGRRPWFFYDGGPDSRVPRAEVLRTVHGIAQLLQSLSPDIALVQEVDRRSHRTGSVDEFQILAEALRLPARASTPYFHVPFVPVPLAAPMGRVRMDLSVFSRFCFGLGERIALSPLDEPVWRRVFNLRRALLRLPIPVSDGRVLHLFQTHLSAFSKGDGTLGKQVEQVIQAVAAQPMSILAGDFNSLPVGVDPRSLGAASILYSDRQTPILPLTERFALRAPPLGEKTYVPWGSNQPDRTLDYLFTNGPLELVRSFVVQEGARWSDHLPVVVDLRVVK